MSTAFTAALPLLEELKENLNRLKTATDEIEKAKQSAGKHQLAAEQQKDAAAAAVRAAQQVASAQETLIDRLGQQQQKSLGEQELLLLEHAESLAQQTGEQISRKLDSVNQSAAKVQVLIDKLLDEQPALLSTIGNQHQQGLDKQHELLRNSVQGWADKLHEQMQTELKLLRQATEMLQKNTRQQHDELSAVANQLQIVAGRVTAFAEVMNAAKFTARLENIEHHQQEALAGIIQGSAANATALDKLAELHHQQEKNLTAELQKGQQKAAEVAEQHRQTTSRELVGLQTAHEQQIAALQTSIEQAMAQSAQAGKQQRLWQVVTIVIVLAVGVASFMLAK
jgi:hypothetical protein